MRQANNNSDQKSREMASTDIVVFLRILLIQFLWIKQSFHIFWFTVQKVRLEVHLVLKLPQAQRICGCSREDQFCNFEIFRHVITDESSYHSKFSDLEYKKYVWKYIWSWNGSGPIDLWLQLRGSILQFFDLPTCKSVLIHTLQ